MTNHSVPKVSVLIPSYNTAYYIVETVAAIQRQTLTDWELIVVDDGSTDNTIDILNTLMAEDERIRIVSLPHEGWYGRGRNVGIDYARGQYLAFMDGDDLYEPEALKTLSNYLDTTSDCHMAYGMFGLIDEQGRPLINQTPGVVWADSQFQVRYLVPHTWENILTSRVSNQVQGLMVRHETVKTIGGFHVDPRIGTCDFEFVIRLFLHRFEGVHALPIIVFRYRQLGTSMTYNAERFLAKIATVRYLCNHVFETLPLPAECDGLRSPVTAAQYGHMLRAACRTNNRQAIIASLQSMWGHPSVHWLDAAKISAKILGKQGLNRLRGGLTVGNNNPTGSSSSLIAPKAGSV